ncbi:hypothetical protein LF1_13460 [Rubripirellula obstinata]|uniref:Calcium-dependent phosphoinositide phospholipase C n=1 Tax=Rubripirellula obstinata TaxID=406547 RepID=A0A5B1CF35_9BACT|nr:phosphatidylinositol-specific phospholipase C1-like protein [Rubripirellula obstinata]KAA1258822.1 hypothetical protein LF1_13460 [Rubripirellula obstinata]
MTNLDTSRFLVLCAAIISSVAHLVCATPCLGQSKDVDVKEPLRLNQIQVIGTHNSYHLAPPKAVLAAIRLTDKKSAEALDYSHKPIHYQLAEIGIRQLEFDIYADPDGGLFANPVAYQPNRNSQIADPNAGGILEKPGFKILHSPDFDYRTNNATLVGALRQVHQFSKRNPNHVPILVLLELKHKVVGPSFLKTIRFDETLLDQVDAEIRSVFGENEMLTPDLVRGAYATLRDAVKKQGWPTLEECRGRVWFALDNTAVERTMYLSGHENLQDRVMFVSSPIDHPTAAFVKINDPVRQFDQIVKAVKSGFIVRTRADAETRQARNNDTRRRDKALGSGAQYISTDYPEPDPRLSPYCVELPGNAEYRTNPVSGLR